MRDMIRYVPSREEAYFKMPEKNHFLKDFIRTIVVIVWISFALIAAFYAADRFITLIKNRVLYQWQVECVIDRQKGYGTGPCDFWIGDRP